MTLTASPTTSSAVDRAAFADLAAGTGENLFTTTDHRTVGSLIIGVALLLGMVGSAVGAFVSQKVDAVVGDRLVGSGWVGGSPDGGFSFARLFLAHGAGMVFLVIVPLFLGLATIAVPAQIGSARMAFPRLQAFVLWGYVSAAALYLAAFMVGDGPPAIDFFGGSPATAANPANRATELQIAALMLIGLVIVLASVNIVVTVLTHRRPGLDMSELRPFTWASFVSAGISLISVPVFLAAMLLLAIDQHFGGGLFNGASGQWIWVHGVWILTRPDAFLLLLPALGIATDIVGSKAKKGLVGGPAAMHLLTGFGVLSLLAWTGGADRINSVVLPTASIQTGLIAVPVALLALLWLGSLAKGVKPDLGLVFVAGFLALLALCAANVAIAAIRGIDQEQAKTVWLVAHSRALLIGAPLIALLGGVVHFTPSALGRSLMPAPAALGGLAVIGGTLVGSLALAGLGYQSKFDRANDALSIIALIGGLVTAGGLALFLLNGLTSALQPGDRSGGPSPLSPNHDAEVAH